MLDFVVTESLAQNGVDSDAVFETHKVENCLACIQVPDSKPGGFTGKNRTIFSTISWFSVAICMITKLYDDTFCILDEVGKSMDNLAVVDSSEGNRNSMVSIGSVISGSSMESGDKRKIIPDSPHGKSLLRKEIIRLVSSMISCVGAKANEQGLLR